MASFSTTAIAGGHKDLIHDVAYDWYGTRMATCSSDQHVKIWDLDEVSTSWFCTATFKAHCGSVWKVTWAHPEFGQVIATCSFDRSAAIWEQVQFGGSLARQSSSGGGGGGSGGCVTNAAAAGGGGGRKQQHSWVKRTSLVDSRTSVTDVKFAPRHMGLMIGTCSADGIIRVYECVDVMNLSEWSLQHEIPCKLPLSCISWNPSVARFHPPMMAVGSDDQRDHNASKMFVFEYHDASRRWLKVETQSGMTDPVHDVAFAPNIGRSYHVLAVVSNQLKIISLKPLAAATASQQMLVAKSRSSSVADEFQALASKYEVRLAGAYNDHNSTVWRACWNVTGTILATSGDDGQIKLWKANYLDQWKCIATLQGNNHQPEAFPDSVVLDHHHQQQQFGQNNRPCLFGDACQMSV